MSSHDPVDPHDTSPPDTNRWFPVGVFLASVFAFMPLCLVGLRTFVAVDLNQVGYPYDAVSEQFVSRPTLQTDQVEWIPWLVSFWDEVKAGNFPLWTHEVAGGSPHGTMPYLGTLSPFNFSFAFLPDWYALNIGVALTFIASQWGMYLLTRRWGAGVIPATIAGVLYGFTGTYLALVHRVTAIVLAPLILWTVDRLIARPNGRRVAALAGLLTWSWLTGFPSGFVYSVYLAGAFALWLIVEDWIQSRDRWSAKWQAGATAVAVVLGMAGSAITLLPFTSEAIARGALSERVWGAGDHMPTLNIFGIFDQAAIGNAVEGPWFAGWNPIETSSQIGFIGLLFTAGFLALGAVGKLRIPHRSRAAWRFLCSLAVVTTILVWLGGPLLWLAYRLPGLGSGPIQRLRYFLAIAIAGLLALGIEAVWTQTDKNLSGETSRPRLSSAITLAFFVAVFVWQTPDYWALMNQWGQRRNVGVAVILGLILTGVAAVALLRGRRFPALRPAAGLLIAALVFFQAWFPFRDLTPQADPDWFYTETAAHESIRDAADDRYRFLAPGAANFYPNGSQVYDLIDLRGVSVYDADFKKVVEVASPDAFRRDPFKITSIAQEWDFASPMLDDLAIGVVALDAIIYTPRSPDSNSADSNSADSNSADSNSADSGHAIVDGYVPTAQLAGTTSMFDPDGTSALHVAVQRRGECEGDRWRMIVSQNGNQLDSASGWLVDLAESEFGTDVRIAFDLSGIEGSALPEIDVAMPFDDDCEASIGITSERFVSVRTEADSQPALTLVATDEAAVYTRPSAKELVWSTGDWATTVDQSEALALIGSGTTGIVVAADDTGDVPSRPTDAVAAEIIDFEFIADGVVATVNAETTALVVVAQHLANGWKASVDGVDADLLRVHGALAGLIVEPGRHDIELRYEPAAFAWGWKISAAALLAVTLLAVLNPKPPAIQKIPRRPKTPTSPQPDSRGSQPFPGESLADETGHEFAERLSEIPE